MSIMKSTIYMYKMHNNDWVLTQGISLRFQTFWLLFLGLTKTTNIVLVNKGWERPLSESLLGSGENICAFSRRAQHNR